MISVNPKAGARSAASRVDQVVELLGQHDFQPEVSTDLDGGCDLANQLHADGRLRVLVGVGGDGTAAELVNRTEAGLPLAMIPAGNENLLAKYLGLAGTPEDIFQTIAGGSLIRLDAGRANGRIFLLMIGCGFDAEVVRRVHQHRTDHISKRTYVKPILETIRSYSYPELQVYWDNPQPPSEPSAIVRWLFAFNLPCYAGNLRIAPRADGTDGLLDVCAFGGGSCWHGLRYAAAVLAGRHQKLADCTTRRVRRLRITSKQEVPYQLDGDPGGHLPVEVEVLPERLTLLVPPRKHEPMNTNSSG